jgi:hypothetical protein
VANLPPLPAGFSLDQAPQATSNNLPPLPAGFKIDTFAGDDLLSDQSMQRLALRPAEHCYTDSRSFDVCRPEGLWLKA